MCLYPIAVDWQLQEKKGMPPYIPCGKCVECVQAYSREWAHRIMQESMLHKHNCFVTLTYKENPIDLVPRDLTLFLKKLRERLEPVRIRYFACGEYGGQKGRPHYHLIIFGWRPDDLELFFVKNGVSHYCSRILADVWSLGFVLVSDLTYETALYTAKYMQKFDDRPHAVAPFTRMSRRPGIGAGAFDVGTALSTGKQYDHGKVWRVPRYYKKLLEADGYDLTWQKDEGKLRSLIMAPSESTLKVRRQDCERKFGFLTVNGKKIHQNLGLCLKSDEKVFSLLQKSIDERRKMLYNEDNQ